jgi:RHS repeat-associated protein
VRQAYEPFGKVILTTTGTKDEFTGKKYHTAMDMNYFGARWYDAEAGRFAGVDPLVASAGDPKSLNAYSYVLNDPVNLVDPTGMAAVMTPGIEELTITGIRGGGGSSFSGLPTLSFRASIPRYGVSVFSFGGSSLFAGGFGLLPGFTSIQFGMALDGYSDECCGEQSEGGDSAENGAAPYDLAAAGPAAIDQVIRFADTRNLIEAMNEAEREVERLWVESKKNGKRKYGDDDAWAWKGMHFQTEPNNPFLEAFDYWSVEVVRTSAGTPRDSVPEPRPLSMSSGGVKWVGPPTRIYCANCPSKVNF